MTAEFLGSSPLRVELREDGLWVLLYPLVFRSVKFGRIFHAPMGFVTDFASVPRIPFVYELAGNRIFKAAVIHDKALEDMPRGDAALLFLEAMEAEGIPEYLRRGAYAAVRLHDQSYREGPNVVLPQGD